MPYFSSQLDLVFYLYLILNFSCAFYKKKSPLDFFVLKAAADSVKWHNIFGHSEARNRKWMDGDGNGMAELNSIDAPDFLGQLIRKKEGRKELGGT